MSGLVLCPGISIHHGRIAVTFAGAIFEYDLIGGTSADLTLSLLYANRRPFFDERDPPVSLFFDMSGRFKEADLRSECSEISLKKPPDIRFGYPGRLLEPVAMEDQTEGMFEGFHNQGVRI